VAFPNSLTGYLVNPDTQALDGSEIYINNACTDAKLLADECTFVDRKFEIQPQTGNLNVLGRLTKNLGSNWQAIVTASLFRSEAEQVGYYDGVNPLIQPNIAMGPGVTTAAVDSGLFPITVPANYTGNTLGAPEPLVYNFPELGQSATQYVTNTYRLFADVKGSLAGWDIDATAGEMYAAVTQKEFAGINYAALQNALNNGYVLGSADGAALSSPEEEVKDTNAMQDLDLRGTRRLFDLAGGPLSLGVGASYNHRYQSARAADGC